MKREAPATQRNRDPILDVLRDVLPETGTVLEIAAGSGEHAVYFAERFPNLTWRPTDADDAALASIAAWRGESRAANLEAPLRLDVTALPWPVEAADAVLCINMIHISPWACTGALMWGAGQVLGEGGVLFTYGPYKIKGQHTSPSNVEFEKWLKSENPDWGVRDLDDVVDLAAANGLAHEKTVAMPANNYSLVFRKGARGPAAAP